MSIFFSSFILHKYTDVVYCIKWNRIEEHSSNVNSSRQNEHDEPFCLLLCPLFYRSLSQSFFRDHGRQLRRLVAVSSLLYTAGCRFSVLFETYVNEPGLEMVLTIQGGRQRCEQDERLCQHAGIVLQTASDARLDDPNVTIGVQHACKGCSNGQTNLVLMGGINSAAGTEWTSN